MGTSSKYKPINNCTKCGKSVVGMSHDEQHAHIEYHRLKDIEDAKQQKLF